MALHTFGAPCISRLRASHFPRKERGHIVQCSAAEFSLLARFGRSSCNVQPIRDLRHPHFLQRRLRRCPSPLFLPPPIPSNSRLILLFCITKDKSNLDLSLSLSLSLSPFPPSCEKWPTDRPSDSGGGATSWLSAGAILRSIFLRSVASSLSRRKKRRNIVL